MRDAKININAWESLAENHRACKSTVRSRVELAEAGRMEELVQKRAKCKASSSTSTAPGFVCSACSGDCHSCISIHSHTRKCYTSTPLCSHCISKLKEADDDEWHLTNVFNSSFHVVRKVPAMKDDLSWGPLWLWQKEWSVVVGTAAKETDICELRTL